MTDNTWQLQEAKTKFSQLVNNTLTTGEPQIVTRHGQKAVVIIPFEDYENLVKPSTGLVDFFQNSPLGKIELNLKRDKDLSRDIEL